MMDTLAVTAGIIGMAGVPLRVASAVAVGMPGCAYLLLEGLLLAARRSPPRAHHPGNALANSAAKRE